MSKGDTYYLQHMMDFSRKIRDLLDNRDRAAYDADVTLQVTLIHWLQVVGEAARQVSEPYQVAHPEIPWRAIIGMRNRIVHDYLGIDQNIVWETGTQRIPELMGMLENLLPPEGERNAPSEA